MSIKERKFIAITHTNGGIQFDCVGADVDLSSIIFCNSSYQEIPINDIDTIVSQAQAARRKLIGNSLDEYIKECFGETLNKPGIIATIKFAKSDVFAGKIVAFVASKVKDTNMNVLGLVTVGDRKYIPTGVEIKVSDFQQAVEIAEKLNSIIFGMSGILSSRIQMISMRDKDD